MQLARVGRPHGLDGEVYIDRCALTPEQLLALGTVEWRKDDRRRTLTLRDARATHDRLLVRFAEVLLRDIAATLTPGELWVEAERLPDLGPTTAYTFQLVGLAAMTPTGERIGTIRDVVQNAGQQLFAIDRDGRELLVPAFGAFLKRVDLAAGVAELDLPPGFEEL